MKGKKTRFISARYSSYKYPELESDPEFARRLGMEVKTSLFFSEIVEDFDLHISPNAYEEESTSLNGGYSNIYPAILQTLISI